MNLNKAIETILYKSQWWNDESDWIEYSHQSSELREALSTLKLFRDAFFHEVVVNEDNTTPD